MKIGIATNLKRDVSAKASRMFCQKLSQVGIEYLVCDNARDYLIKSTLPRKSKSLIGVT